MSAEPLPPVDRSDAADAARFRWMLDGNGAYRVGPTAFRTFKPDQDLRDYPCREVDRSDAADAARFRWMLDGNGAYWYGPRDFCLFPSDQDQQDNTRLEIDELMDKTSS